MVRPVYKDGDFVRVTSKVRTPPTYYEDFQGVSVAGLRTYLPLDQEISYGDFIVIEGLVEDNKIKKPQVISIRKAEGFLVGLRSLILNFFNKYLPQDHAALIAGIVLGDKGGLSEGFSDKLKASGTIHVVVASGQNVTFVAAFLVAIITIALKRSIAIPFVIGGIFIYSVLAGFEPPIVRAAIMGTFAFVAQEFGRIYTTWHALVLTALGMLVINPLWSVDLGFILSFVATVSILLFHSRINKKLLGLPNFFREGLSSSFAAQIGVTPILFVTFGNFNILSPIINALILWTIPLIMSLAGLAALTSLLSGRLASLILYLTYPLTSWFIFIVELFS